MYRANACCEVSRNLTKQTQIYEVGSDSTQPSLKASLYFLPINYRA